MTRTLHDPDPPQDAAATVRLAEAVHLQMIEGNPLSPDEIAMFEMFEREAWPAEDRRAFIARRIGGRGDVAAAGFSGPTAPSAAPPGRA